MLAYFKAVWRMYRRAAVAPNWGFHPRSNKKVIEFPLRGDRGIISPNWVASLPDRVPLAPDFFFGL